MAIRTVNGNQYSEDGWPIVDEAGCTWITVPGTDPTVTLEVQSGIPAAVLGAWAADWNAYVEKLRDADSASWTESNSVLGTPGQNDGSNHLGGTAEDLNWNSHPMGPHAPDDVGAGFLPAQVDEINRMKAYYTFTAKDSTVIQIVWWANDWDTPHDSMHSQMGYDTYDHRDEVQSWIDNHIRSDGFSTYRRGGTPANPSTPAQPGQPSTPVTPATPADTAAAVLYDAIPVIDEDRAAELVGPITAGLAAAACTNNLRIAEFLAQTGWESDGYNATEEYADGSAYEGRCSDLGNCSPGDGVKYKGRGWIMLTGKAHYAAFSQWANAQGLVPTPTYFVDNPTELANIQWAGIVSAWYWTVARPQINALCDAGDLVGVTKAINGGTNGLEDGNGVVNGRRTRYNQAIALGDRLLTLITPATTPDPGDTPVTLESITAQITALQEDVTWLREQLDVSRPDWDADADLGTDSQGRPNNLRTRIAQVGRTVDALAAPKPVKDVAKKAPAKKAPVKKVSAKKIPAKTAQSASPTTT